MKIRFLGLGAAVAFVALAMAASIASGKSPIPLATVYDALFAFDGTREQLIVRSVRVPRAMLALLAGACLAMAGAIMQGITRNALAGPELFGVNQGAALAIVLSIFLLGGVSPAHYFGYAFIGAILAGGLVYMLGSIGIRGLTPIKLIVAGSTINLLLGSLTQGILIFDEQSLDTMRFWLAGSLTGRSTGQLAQVAPLMAAGIVAAIVMSRQINLLSLGEDVARGLGSKTWLVNAGALAIVALLAGSSVSVAGPIGFIGLAAPHLARFLVGADYRWILPYSALIGAALLLLADVAARFVVPAQEISAGIVTAVLGAPFLIYLAQRRA